MQTEAHLPRQIGRAVMDDRGVSCRADLFWPSQPSSVGEALWLFYARLQDSIKEIDAWLSVTAEDVLSPCSLQ